MKVALNPSHPEQLLSHKPSVHACTKQDFDGNSRRELLLTGLCPKGEACASSPAPTVYVQSVESLRQNVHLSMDSRSDVMTRQAAAGTSKVSMTSMQLQQQLRHQQGSVIPDHAH